MRRLVLILLLANVLLFGWNRGWFDARDGEAGVERNAHRLRPVPLARLEPAAPASTPPAAAQSGAAASTQAPALPSPATDASPSAAVSAPPGLAAGAPPVRSPEGPGASVAPAPTPAEAASPPQASTSSAPEAPAQGSSGASGAPSGDDPVSRTPFAEPSAAAAPSPFTPVVCRAFSPIDEERARALQGALEQSGARVDAQRIEIGSSYLVYLPPAATVEEAHQRLLDARRIGRDDAFVIQDGPLRMAISLGLFRFESAARAMVAQLERAGETRAVVAPRPPMQVRVALQAAWAQEGAEAIATMLGAQFDVAVRDCP